MVAHDLRSSLRVIGIYSDLLRTETGLAQLDGARIGQLCESIATAIDKHSEQLGQIDCLIATAVDMDEL